MNTVSSESRTDQARRLISLTDLTSLNEADDAASVHALAMLACAAPVKPAAVCIWARWIPVALKALLGSGIPVCAVANFPGGAASAEAAAARRRRRSQRARPRWMLSFPTGRCSREIRTRR